MKKILKFFNDLILCIRFPFLYPRNRFTGTHYNNWKIIEFHRRYYPMLYQSFFFKVLKESEIPDDTKRDVHTKGIEITKFNRHAWILSFDKTTRRVFIRDSNNNRIHYFIEENKILDSGSIIDAVFLDDIETIIVSDDSVLKEDFCKLINVDLDETLMKYIIKFLDWLNDYPLQWIHCFPGHTELDALETGWRKVFGIQLCKDLKKQLKKENYLKKFRIIQIKEKWGVLTFYHNGSMEIEKIIDKYSDLSSKICIHCGKPATKMTTGWISYYCDDCFPKGYKYKEVE